MVQGQQAKEMMAAADTANITAVVVVVRMRLAGQDELQEILWVELGYRAVS